MRLGGKLLPGLSAQPQISLEPLQSIGVPPAECCHPAPALHQSLAKERGLCDQLVPPGKWAEAKPSHCAWHLGYFCVCRQAAEKECALQQPLHPHSPTAAGRGWQEPLSIMQSKDTRARLPAAPHKALGLNRLGVMPRRATHGETLPVGTTRSQNPVSRAA